MTCTTARSVEDRHDAFRCNSSKSMANKKSAMARDNVGPVKRLNGGLIVLRESWLLNLG